MANPDSSQLAFGELFPTEPAEVPVPPAGEPAATAAPRKRGKAAKPKAAVAAPAETAAPPPVAALPPAVPVPVPPPAPAPAPLAPPVAEAPVPMRDAPAKRVGFSFGPGPVAAPLRQVLTVLELTLQIKRLLERQVGQVWVTGEITNLRAQSSGHLYFTLKDADSQVSCVLFRSDAREARNLVQDGRKIVARGEVTVYEPRGQYQLRVTAVELHGVGALQLAFERLKQRLQAAGWFAPERKRPLPRYPRRIGLVTSPTGAAIRDVLHVIRRRNPGLEIILTPCRVQGAGAAGEIAAAIARLNDFAVRHPAAAPDLILVTRGGGSLEDLWAFNEEVVARAIFESALPVVSAVGHEIDFTISDFVADLRAATPSAAAELITEGVFATREFVAGVGDRLRTLARRHWERGALALAQVEGRLARQHPRRLVNEALQHLDDLQAALARAIRSELRARQLAAGYLRDRLQRLQPRRQLQLRREQCRLQERRLRELARQQLTTDRHRLAAAAERLRLLGPEQVLARGYSITLDAATGAVIRRPEDAPPWRVLTTRLQAGELRSRVEPG